MSQNIIRGKRVLVTGGAGFIGSHLVDRLIEEQLARLVVVDNFFLGYEPNLAAAREAHPDLMVERLDAGDLASMQSLVAREQIEVAFNLAVVPLPTSFEYPAWAIFSNVAICTTFCELARVGSLQTLVHCSSSEAYGSALYSAMDEAHPLVPTTPYAASKAGGDQIVLSYCETFGIDPTIARPFNNYGPPNRVSLRHDGAAVVVRRGAGDSDGPALLTGSHREVSTTLRACASAPPNPC